MHPTDKVAIRNTGVWVTRLGLGGGPLSGTSGSPGPDTSEEQAVALIHRAFELGIRYFDTAPMYGVGESEKRYARGIRDFHRDSYVLSTKVGRVLNPSTPLRAGPEKPGSAQLKWEFDFSREGVLRSFRESLERLGLEYIDILLIHDPDDHYEQAISETYPALAELRSRGLVRAIGAGMNQWQMELRFAQEGDFDCFLLAGRYTLLDQSGLAEFLPFCEKNGIGVIAGGPYNSGILASDLGPTATFNYRVAPPEILEKARRIKAVCDKHEVPLKAAALQFILAHPALVAAIPGGRSVEEVEENFRMAAFPIPKALWTDLRRQHLIPREAPTPS
jgi:D-threo-aldose 1-dehydrogenase